MSDNNFLSYKLDYNFAIYLYTSLVVVDKVHDIKFLSEVSYYQRGVVDQIKGRPVLKGGQQIAFNHTSHALAPIKVLLLLCAL